MSPGQFAFWALISAGVSGLAAGICCDFKLKHTANALGVTCFVCALLVILCVAEAADDKAKANNVHVSSTQVNSS